MMKASLHKFFALFIVLSFIHAACFVPSSFAKGATTVYVTGKGKKYHYRDCQTLAKSRNVKAINIQQAKKDGYKPCKVCRPNR